MSGSINAVLGWENALDAGSLTVSTEEPALPAANLRNPLGSPSTGWQTPAGVTSAWVQSVPAAPVAWRAVMLARTNLSGAATWRVRLGDVASLVEEAGIVNATLRPENALPGTFTRASAAWSFDAAGVLVETAANLPRWHFVGGVAQGLLVEASSTNRALWSRDLTNAAWVKTNLTAALAATGLDAVANTASRLTATAGNATALQTVTLASGARNFRLWLRRVTGSGAVQITINGGTAWQAVTLTAAWQPFDVSATVTNPQIGVRIVTSGDVIEADVAQLEDQVPATSPIITTSAGGTRAQELLRVPVPAGLAQAGVAAAEMEALSSPGQPRLQVTNTANTNRVLFRFDGNLVTSGLLIQNNTTVFSGANEAAVAFTSYRMALSYGITTRFYRNGFLSGEYTHGGPLAAMQDVLFNTDRGSGLLRRFCLFASLTAAQAQAFSAAWSTITGTIYDSGSLGGVTRGQAVHVLPVATSAAACRIDVSDPTNPDGFLNIPLIYAGPAWQLATNLSRESAQAQADGSRRAVTRGGQEIVEQGWLRRAWDIRLENQLATDAEQRLLGLESAARRGVNILCIPRPLTQPARDAVFGLASDFTRLGFSTSSGLRRSLGFTVSERL